MERPPHTSSGVSTASSSLSTTGPGLGERDRDPLGPAAMKALVREQRRWAKIQVASSVQRMRARVPTVDLDSNPFRGQMQLRDAFELQQLNRNPRLYLESYERQKGGRRVRMRNGIATTSPRGYVDGHSKTASQRLRTDTVVTQNIVGSAVTNMIARQGAAKALQSIASNKEVYGEALKNIKSAKKAHKAATATANAGWAATGPTSTTYGHRPRSANRHMAPLSLSEEVEFPESSTKEVRTMGLLHSDDLEALLGDVDGGPDPKLLAQLALAPQTSAQSLFRAASLPSTAPPRSRSTTLLRTGGATLSTSAEDPASPKSLPGVPSASALLEAHNMSKTHMPAGLGAAGEGRGWWEPAPLIPPKFQTGGSTLEAGGMLSEAFDLSHPDPEVLSPVDEDVSTLTRAQRRRRNRVKKQREQEKLEAGWNGSVHQLRTAETERLEMMAQRSRSRLGMSADEAIGRFRKRAAGVERSNTCDDKYALDDLEKEDVLLRMEQRARSDDLAAELLRSLRGLPEDPFDDLSPTRRAELEASPSGEEGELLSSSSPGRIGRGTRLPPVSSGDEEEEEEGGDEEQGQEGRRRGGPVVNRLVVEPEPPAPAPAPEPAAEVDEDGVPHLDWSLGDSD